MGSDRLPRRAPRPLQRAVPLRHAERMARGAPQAFGASLAAGSASWAHAPRFASVLDPKYNSFSVLRLMLALAVLVSHAVYLATGHFASEPLVGATGYSLGQYGVQAFFVLSGIVVTQSLVKRGDIIDYARARALRIFPALIVCVAVTALIIGPALSMFGARGYFKSFGWIDYVARTLSLSTGSAQLPGLFTLNPASGVVNQSLWTLKYEVACYLVLGGVAAVLWRLPMQRLAATVCIAVWATGMLIVRPNLIHDGNFFDTLTYFALFFGTGVSAYFLRDSLKLAWQPAVVLGLSFAISIGTDFAEITSALFIGYAIIWLSTFSFGGLRTYTNQNDYSYGMYIYGYPVTQALLTLWPTINIVALIAGAIAATLVLAFLSWEFVERPALALVHRWRQPASVAPMPLQPDADAGSHVTDAADQPWTQPAADVFTPAATPVAVSNPPMLHVDTSRLQARLAKIAEARGPSQLH